MSSKSTYHIALPPETHRRLRTWAAEAQAPIGDIVAELVDRAFRRVRQAQQDGTIPIDSDLDFIKAHKLLTHLDCGQMTEAEVKLVATPQPEEVNGWEEAFVYVAKLREALAKKAGEKHSDKGEQE